VAASPETELGVGIGLATTKVGVPRATDRLDPNADDDSVPLRRLFAGSVRGYATHVPTSTDRVAITAGIGLIAASSGMVALTADLGAQLAYPNDTFVPSASAFFALSMPMRKGIEIGSERERPHTALYVGGLLGGGAPLDAHFVSVEGGFAHDLLDSRIDVMSLSLGERWQSQMR
jgi:hypothetical protein